MSNQSNRFVRRFFIGIAVVTVVLGVIGYSRLPLQPSDGLNTEPGLWRFFDYLYMSLQLLWLGGRDVKGEPLLLIARWVGALFAFGVVVKLLAPAVGERLLWLRLRFLSGHTVVVGLGDKGRAFLADAGSRGPIVAIDLNPVDDDSLNDPARSETERRAIRRRVYLLRGDAGRRKWILRLNLKRAARAFLVTQSDALNVELARKIMLELAGHRPRTDPLRLFVHVGQGFLTDDLLSDYRVPPSIELRPFSLPNVSARLLLARWPLAVAAREQGAPRMNLVFVGFDAFAEALLLHTLRLGALGGQGRPRVTIFTPARAAVRMRLDGNYPVLRELVDPPLEVRERDLAVDFSETELAEIEGEGGPTPVTAIFVAAASDAESFLLARRVRRTTARARRWQAPLFVRLQRTEQYGGSLVPLASGKVLADVIEPFGELRSLCSEAALRDWHERLAQRLHDGYLSDERAAAVPDRHSPAKEGWNDISEEFREANRRAIDHFPLKLATAGWIVRGEIPRLGRALELDDRTVDALARLEHESWMSEKLLAGWRRDVERDDRRRRHDYLVDYERLGAARQKDVSQLRRIESLLQVPGDPEVFGRHPDAAWPTVFRERTIGLVGHNLISAANGRAIGDAAQALLSALGAEERLGPAGEEFWTFVTPLAPGADYVLPRVICRTLAAIPQLNQPLRRFRLLVVRGLPPRHLARAYLEQAAGRPDASPDGVKSMTHGDFARTASADSTAVIAGLLDQFARGELACERVIDAGPPDAVAAPAAQAGFASANRYLIERCDDLVAVIDPRRYGQPRPFDVAHWQALEPAALPAGGTGALVSAWLRRAPNRYTAVRPLSPTGLHPIEID